MLLFFSASGCASVKCNMCVHRGGCRKLHQLIQDEGPDCGGGVGHAAALHDLRGLSGMHLHVKADSRRRERDEDAWSEDCRDAERSFN